MTYHRSSRSDRREIFPERDWSFDEMVAAAFEKYAPGGITQAGYRNIFIKSWATIVGRDKALWGLESFIQRRGGLEAAAGALDIAPSTLRRLRTAFARLSSGSSLVDQVERALEEGEGQLIEFKEEIPKDAQSLAREVAAFATSGGGTVFVGVSDDGTVVGYDDSLERLEGIAGSVDPVPRTEISVIGWREVQIGVIRVLRSEEPIYYVANRPYIRQGTISRPARPDEVRYLVLSHASGLPHLAKKPPSLGGHPHRV